MKNFLLKSPKIGMVFNGGGARGPFQIGVYLAMIKYGLDKNIQACSGASVGCFSEVMLLLNDPERIINLWKLIDNDTIKTNKKQSKFSKISSTLVKKSGYYSRDGLVDLIQNNLNLSQLLSESKIPIYASLAACNFDNKGKISSYEPVYVKLNGLNSEQILNYLLATSAIPYVFDPVIINDVTYVDPMMADNEPYTPIMNVDFDYLFILPLNDSHLEKVYPEDFPKTIVDFTCPQMMELKRLNMIDFDPNTQEQYISWGYQTACLLFSLMREHKALYLPIWNKKKHNKEHKQYSLASFGIKDIRFDIMKTEDILKEVFAGLSKKDKKRLNYHGTNLSTISE